MVVLVQTTNLDQQQGVASPVLLAQRAHREKRADIKQCIYAKLARGAEKRRKKCDKQVEAFADYTSAQRQERQEKEVNVFFALADAMKYLGQGEEQEIVAGTMQVDLKNTQLEEQNRNLSVLQKKIEDQVVKLNSPPHQTGWKAIVGAVVGVVVGVLLAVASDGIGAALAPEAEAAITGTEEGAAVAEGEGGGTATVTAYPKTAAFCSSNITKMGLLMGSMATGSAVGNAAERADSQKDSNGAAVANAHLQDDQTQMQRVMNDLQRAENEAQNVFQILVINPQQQQTMTQQMFGDALSSFTSTTTELFKG